MNKRFADMFGYTHKELDNSFHQHIESFAGEIGCDFQTIIKKLQRQYNGYRFSKKNVKVYNPFSILKAFDQMDFQDYWFETGTPAFLINLLRKKIIIYLKLKVWRLTKACLPVLKLII